MKIAIIIRRLNVMGGVQRQILELARELKKRGHTATIYTFLYDAGRLDADVCDGLRVVSLGRYPSSRNALLDFWNEWRASWLLARRIDPDTDFLNPHDQVSYRVAYLFKKLVRTIPSVWMMNDMPTKTWGYWRNQECGMERSVSWPRRLLWRALDGIDIRTAIRSQDAIAVLDERDRAWVREYFRKDATVVRSGVDAARFPYRPPVPMLQQALRLLSVGILFPHRRFEDLIAAVHLLRDRGYRVCCTIIGGFSPQNRYAQRLMAMRDACGLETVIRFTGAVSVEELKRQYRENDIFIFPSHLQSWGLAVFEAMASGLPVIVSATAGAAGVLADGRTALIVPPKSPEAIAAAAVLLAENQNLYRALAENGRRFVEREMSWQRYADAMEAIFRARCTPGVVLTDCRFS